MNATKRPTAAQVKEKLGVDTASYRNGIFTVRDEFFYTHGRKSEHLANAVKAAYPDAVILEHDEIWKPFRGGGTTAQNSHWLVRFTLPNPVPALVAASAEAVEVCGEDELEAFAKEQAQ